MARIELSNIGGGGTTLSLTTTGTSGAATLAGSVLNIPIYQGQLTLTTTGTSGAATLVGDTLNIPNYATGGSPAGSAGQVQFNSTPAGSFAASANLAWDNSNVRLNIGAPLSPTGRLNVKGSGTLTTVNTRLTDSGDTELLKVLDNGSTNIGANFNWDNSNGRLAIGGNSFSTGVTRLQINDNSTGAPQQFLVKASSSNSRGSFSLENDISANGIRIQIAGSSYTAAALRGMSLISAYGSTASNTGLMFLTESTSSPIYFRTGSYSNDNAMMISAASAGTRGNVAIGVDAFGGRLTIRGSNASSGTNALLVQNSTPDDIYKIENNGKITYFATNTAAGTTGAQTINRPSGTVNFGAGATSLVVTNSLCTTTSLVFAEVRTNDATAQIKNVVPGSGSFTINLSAAATAETSVGFFIIN